MSIQDILTTKLFIPPPRPVRVSRPRLIEQLNTGLHRKLTLISAPAGFGKTTLVTDWIDSTQSGATTGTKVDKKIAWLSIDEGDNDPTRFLAYMIAALRTVDQNLANGIRSALQSPQAPAIEAALSLLINEISVLPSQLILVLDDYHLIEARSVHDALTFLLENQPPSLHLVILTRVDPPLPLARLRARDKMTELRASDLCFTSNEVAEFLTHVMSLQLSDENIVALENRTEGWIAGLHLAAITLQGHDDATQRIKSFTGNQQFVLDYLIEEVLKDQSDSIQNFLLKTAVLDRLTGSLCDALTGQDNGQATLESLDRTNLFIVPLDGERRWYRYHHLFADLLTQRLLESKAGQPRMLHLRASKWFEQNRLTDEAIEHALSASDYERSANLIHQSVDDFWRHGELFKIRRWLEKLPTDVVLSKPKLGIFRAYVLLASGQQDAGEYTLQETEKRLESSTGLDTESSLSESERRHLLGRLDVVRALILSQRGDVQGIIQSTSKALEYLPKQDLIWRNIAAFALGDAYSYQGDMRASYQVRAEALKACKEVGDVYFIITANLKLAATLRAQGMLQRTVEICSQQMQLAKDHGLSQTHIVGWCMAFGGEALAELDDLEGALLQARKGVELTERGGNLGTIGYGYLCLMRILFSKGDLAGVVEVIQKVEKRARESEVPAWLMNQVATWQSRVWLARGNLPAVSQWMQERGFDSDGELTPLCEIDFYLMFEYIMLARYLIGLGRFDEAIELLQHLLENAKVNDRTSNAIEILILQSLVFHASEDSDQAMLVLEQALKLAEPEGFIRIFVDEGLPMASLLYKALSQEIAPEYVQRLLAAFPVTEPEEADSTKPPADRSGLIDPLSEREIEVLQLVSEGLTNQEIGSRLFLSLNTVKAHTRNIYGKLGVNNRTQAASRAKDLGILPST